MFRRSLLVVAALLVLVPSLAQAQAGADIGKAIEANERAVAVALQKGDAAAFKALIADDAVSGDGSGFMPISEFMKMLPQMKIQSWAIDQVKVTKINDGAALITYRWTGKGTMMGQAFPSPTMASTVWANRGGKWLAVFHQETIATPPPPPPAAATKKPAPATKKPEPKKPGGR